MKKLKSKTFLGVLCLGLAAAVSFLLLPQFFAKQQATGMVPRARQDIPAGTIITEDMISLVETGTFGLPEKLLTSADAIVGMAASESVRSGEFFWKDDLITAEEYKSVSEAESKGLKSGLCLVTIELPSPSSGIAGILRAGNLVNVFSCQEDEETEAYNAEKELTGLYVYAVLNPDLESLDELDRQQEEAEEGDTTRRDFKPAYLVLRCTEEQAKTLMKLEREETLHLTLQKTGG